ncbi:transposase family protein, partial [Thiorhodospira sibirica]|uniref:transposase family protein n=1 Tax=Thiorhodospira sibirica TaxID=154347 RepID=UPI00022C4C9A
MGTQGKLYLADVFVGIHDPRQAKKVEHELVELLVAAVSAVLAGADDFVQIEAWGRRNWTGLAGSLLALMPTPDARAATRFNNSSPQHPMPIALKSSVLDKIHAIALGHEKLPSFSRRGGAQRRGGCGGCFETPPPP